MRRLAAGLNGVTDTMTIDTAEIPVRIAGTGDYVPSRPVHSAEFDERCGRPIIF